MKIYLLTYGIREGFWGIRSIVFPTYNAAYEWGKKELLEGITEKYKESRIAQKKYKDDMAGFIKDYIEYRFEITAYDPWEQEAERAKWKDVPADRAMTLLQKEMEKKEKNHFRRDDTCKEIHWSFDAFGNLTERLYEGCFGGYEYMPWDEAEDAGTKFKVGDFVRVSDTARLQWSCEDVLYVVAGAPGKKGVREHERQYLNTWENDYNLFPSEGPNGHIHVHESEIRPFKGRVPKDSPLRFWRDFFTGRIDPKIKIKIGAKKMTLEKAVYYNKISFHEGISWRDFMKKKMGK